MSTTTLTNGTTTEYPDFSGGDRALQSAENKIDYEYIKLVLETWKKTVDVQQHFNDLELRIRNYAVTVVVAVLGVSGVALKDHIKVTVYNITTPLAAWFIGAGIIAWGAFYYMDQRWYHRLLKGAVKHGEAIESQLEDVFPSITLAKDISKASPNTFLWFTINSQKRIDLFYLIIASVLLFLFIGIMTAA